MFYHAGMLAGISFWTDDKIWRGILTDLGAEFAPRDSADFAAPKFSHKMPPLELKAWIIKTIDANESKIIKKICGETPISDTQRKIILKICKSGAGGISASELQAMLGYSADAATNTVGTIVCQLRKIFGKDFIVSKNGRYNLNNS
jgi:hypothetical protein